MTILATLAVAALFAGLVAAYAVVLCRLDAAEQRGYARGRDAERQVQEWARNAARRATSRENGPARAYSAPTSHGTPEIDLDSCHAPSTLSAGGDVGQPRVTARRDIPAWLREPGGSERSR